MRNVLADSGLFIGLFDADDKHHRACREFVHDYRGRLLTTWQVITEALAMLSLGGQQALLAWLDRGVKAGLIEIRCTNPADIENALKLTTRYRDLPMDFADVSVYLLAVETGVRDVASVDHRDFAVYRLPDRRLFNNVLVERGN